jgi:sugar phosphate isomerase/epimerase
MQINRRRFLTTATALTGGSFLSACNEDDGAGGAAVSPFKISLAQWSVNKELKKGELDNLDFPKLAKESFGITAVEWVNQFFNVEHATLGLQPKDQAYLAEMKKRTDDLGVTNVLIMCDRVGSLGDPDAAKRTAAVEGHYAWLDAAKFLGCHSIRVNAASDNSLSPEEQADLCTDGLRRLSEHAAPMGLGVIVENHGGLSSNGAWLASVLGAVGLPNCGSLPDFGNFYVARNRGDAAAFEKEKAIYGNDPAYTEDESGLGYDRYRGIADLMPYAKGVSAKAHDFDASGNEVHTDYVQAMTIVKAAGYSGYVGIEYEGKTLGAMEGIKATQALLERTFAIV